MWCKRCSGRWHESCLNSAASPRGIRSVVGCVGSLKTSCGTIFGVWPGIPIAPPEARMHIGESCTCEQPKTIPGKPRKALARPMQRGACPRGAGSLWSESGRRSPSGIGVFFGASSWTANRQGKSEPNTEYRQMQFDWSKCESCASSGKRSQGNRRAIQRPKHRQPIASSRPSSTVRYPRPRTISVSVACAAAFRAVWASATLSKPPAHIGGRDSVAWNRMAALPCPAIAGGTSDSAARPR